MSTVLVVGPTPPPFHGCSVATEWVLRFTKSCAYEVVYLDTSDRRSLDNLGRWDFGNISRAIAACIRTAALCVRGRPEVVYLPISQNTAGFLRDAALILIARWLCQPKVVVHLHGSHFLAFYSRSGRAVRRLVDLTMKSAWAGIVLGAGLKPQLGRWIEPSRVYVVPNGTDLLRVSWPQSRANGVIRCLFLGNLLKFKGVHDVVAVGANLVRRHPDLRLVFLGRWTSDPVYQQSGTVIMKECMDIVRRCDRPSAFEFRGEANRDQVAAALTEADFVVLPSEDEGLPLVLLEAMAASRAVVSTTGVGAIDEVVVDGHTGILVKAGDRAALEAAMERLITDASLRMTMGVAGRKRCEELYSEDVWGQRLKRVFDDALGRNPITEPYFKAKAS